MKRFLSAALCLPLVFSFVLRVCALSPDSSPADTVLLAMQELKDWTLPAEKPAELPDALDSAWRWAELLGDALPRVLQKVEYELGNSKITGGTAVVDLSVTAPDVRRLCGELTAEAAAVLSISRLLGKPVDFFEQFQSRAAAALDSDELLSIRTDVSIYLTKGGDGRWKIDYSDERNYAFISALFPAFSD